MWINSFLHDPDGLILRTGHPKFRRVKYLLNHLTGSASYVDPKVKCEQKIVKPANRCCNTKLGEINRIKEMLNRAHSQYLWMGTLLPPIQFSYCYACSTAPSFSNQPKKVSSPMGIIVINIANVFYPKLPLQFCTFKL